ncbi:MAG: DUF72 domain-containing protein [Acidobacteriota bacterium]
MGTKLVPMEFGKLPSVDGVDFTLPHDDPATARVLARSENAGPPRIAMGTAAWGDASFVGSLYPPGTKQREYLHHYSRQFGAIELNTTFYGLRVDSLRKWAESAPRSFRFCPKFPGSITHERRLRRVEALTDEFFTALDVLGERLGLPWMVLPPQVGPDSLGDLRSFVQRTAPLRRFAVELRHPAWFSDVTARAAVGELFEEHGISWILTDVAGRRDVLHCRLTSPTVVLRFVGNSHHPSDWRRLEAWTERLTGWCRSGVEQLYLFLHQPVEELNIAVADRIGPSLGEALNVSVQVPQRVEAPRQDSLF